MKRVRKSSQEGKKRSQNMCRLDTSWTLKYSRPYLLLQPRSSDRFCAVFDQLCTVATWQFLTLACSLVPSILAPSDMLNQLGTSHFSTWKYCEINIHVAILTNRVLETMNKYSDFQNALHKLPQIWP